MRMICRFCRGVDGTVVLDLGRQPVAKHFPRIDGRDGAADDPVHPLRLWLCATCGLVQLAEDAHAPAEETPAVEPAAMVAQARHAIELVAASGLLPSHGTLTEYPSPHGGSWVAPLAQRGLRELPVADRGQADVVLDCIGMMHDADQAAALAERVERIAPDGVLLMQYHSLSAILTHGQWNDARHGHLAYYSTPALVEMLRKVGLEPVTAWWFDLYGGTVLLAARRDGVPDAAVRRIVDAELELGVRDPEVVRGLQRAATDSVSQVREWLLAARRAGVTVRGYAAASRAVPLLNYAGIGPDLLPAIADASPAKQGCRIPGVGIPIVAPAELIARHPVSVLLFVPDLLDEARASFPEVEERGGRWVVLDPGLRAVPPVSGPGRAGWATGEGQPAG